MTKLSVLWLCFTDATDNSDNSAISEKHMCYGRTGWYGPTLPYIKLEFGEEGLSSQSNFRKRVIFSSFELSLFVNEERNSFVLKYGFHLIIRFSNTILTSVRFEYYLFSRPSLWLYHRGVRKNYKKKSVNKSFVDKRSSLVTQQVTLIFSQILLLKLILLHSVIGTSHILEELCHEYDLSRYSLL